MTQENTVQLPDYLKSVEAFKLGEEIATVLKKAAKNIEGELERILFRNDESPLCVLLTCELIADSIGHPCWSGCWNIYIRELLFKTKYPGNNILSHKSIEALDRVSAHSMIRSNRHWESSIASLTQRLNMPAMRIVRTNPIISKANYKKIAPGFSRRGQSFGLVNDVLCGSDPALHWVLDATSMKAEAVNEISLHFATEPSSESVEAIRILLHRFRDHVSSLRCDAWSGPTGGQPSVMSRAFWNQMRREVLCLKKIERFESSRFAIDDETATEIIKIPTLDVFRVCKHEGESEINKYIELENAFVEALLQRAPIFLVDVPYLEAKDEQRILGTMPDIILQIDGRRVFSGKQADEAAAQNI